MLRIVHLLLTGLVAAGVAGQAGFHHDRGGAAVFIVAAVLATGLATWEIVRGPR
jgi:hypothetical protein